MSNLKAGVIGLGIGEQHVRACLNIPNVDVAMVCDGDSDKAQEVGERYGVERRVVDWRSVTDDPEIDIVTIASYDNNHAEQAIAALANGKHVFIEKPICLSPQEAGDIRAALAANPDLKLSSNLPLRTCPRFARLRDAIQSGDMGQTYHIEADYLWGRAHKLIGGWRREMPFYSIVLGASIHMIDLVLWLKGEVPVEVSGYGSRLALGQDELGFDDFAINLFRFKDGSVAKVAAHGGCAHPHFHVVHAYGTARSFHHDLAGAYWVDSSDPAAEPRVETAAYPDKAERGRVLGSFLTSILDPGMAPLVSSEDTFLTMNLAFAADRAINDGRPQMFDNS
ncbi:MAG: Gfo/Idh/MocA family oxidoreductase [Rhodospirillales bacterium]|nr:Gfo/Idh/MocA family oxidoreductase [Rhodospirillales bacterium]